MKKLVLGVCFLIAFAAARPCTAAEVAFGFTGGFVVVPLGAPPFGLPPLSGPISGHFAYDMTSVGTPAPVDGTSYLQHRFDGFFVSFGGGAATFRADDYVVSIIDDFAQPSGTFDSVDITFEGADLPLSSLIVNGAPQPIGVGGLKVFLRFPDTTFVSNDDSLPTTLPGGFLSNAFAPESVLNDFAGPGVPNVLFSIESVFPITLPPPPAQSPEPTAALLCLSGLMLICGSRLRCRPTRR